MSSHRFWHWWFKFGPLRWWPRILLPFGLSVMLPFWDAAPYFFSVLCVIIIVSIAPIAFLSIGETETAASFLARRLIEEGLREVTKPALAEKFASVLASPNEREALLGCLEEAFHRAVDRHGVRFARRQYWIDVVHLIVPMTLRKLAKLASAGTALELLRRIMGW